MTELIRVSMLYCGQGMATLVEVCPNENSAPEYLALIDCGGNQQPKPQVIADIMSKLDAKQDHLLDCVLVSHQDGDHHRILDDLGDKMNDEDYKVGKLWVGGSNWSPGAKKVLMTFARMTVVKSPKFNVPQMTDYGSSVEVPHTKSDQLTHLAKHKNLYIRCLITGKAPVEGSPNNIENSSSAVFVVHDQRFSAVLPGDATYDTLLTANPLLKAVRAAGISLIPRVILVEMPHHGAIATMYRGYDPNTSAKQDSGWKPLDDFASVLNPDNVGASAGPLNSYGHPVLEVIRRFNENAQLVPDWEKHYFAAYGFEANKWDNVETVLGEFSTVQVLPAKWIQDQSKGKQRTRRTTPGLVFGNQVFKFVDRGRADLVTFEPLGYLDPPDETILYAGAP